MPRRWHLPLTSLSVVSASALVALVLAAGVSGAPAQVGRQCETPTYENGIDLVFARAKTQAAADANTRRIEGMGFKGVKTIQESCTSWKTALRGIEVYSIAVTVQSEARRVRLFPTIECVLAQEIGQIQAIFGTRATLADLQNVIDTARRFGYIGLKTKRAPCGGYQAYVAGFTSRVQALDFARTASERTGLKVFVVKA
jgi:hypothetical protein